MANNTGNPVEPNGSDDPRDLIDNAAIGDKLINSSDLTWPGRLGKVLKTWAGLMQQVTDYLIAQGYESVYLVYGAGVIVQRQTQLVQRDGELYRILNSADIPLTLIGAWTTDALKLQAVGDAALRQALASVDSDVLVGGVPAEQLGELAGAVTIAPDGRARAIRFIAGTGSLVGPAVRDGYVSKQIVEGLTDFHDFAADSRISGVTDAGTYGAFDATTVVEGNVNQNYM